MRTVALAMLRMMMMMTTSRSATIVCIAVAVDEDDHFLADHVFACCFLLGACWLSAFRCCWGCWLLFVDVDCCSGGLVDFAALLAADVHSRASETGALRAEAKHVRANGDDMQLSRAGPHDSIRCYTDVFASKSDAITRIAQISSCTSRPGH